ncbi:hypothetical protein AB0H57_26825 [Micromonospora sp. NPDC050686]|uniref:hypothetical protein n=1 Tax=Micromonospora sp. NPDC050686 TaxID=3154631 RepID=UPI0033FFDAC3
MALRPANEDQVHHAVDEVRVYLDDLTDLVANLADYGPIQVDTTHQDGERSLADTIDDLAGRTDIWQVAVSVLEPSENPVVVPDSVLVVDLGTYGVSYTVHHARPDLRRIADHFIKTLVLQPPFGIMAGARG